MNYDSNKKSYIGAWMCHISVVLLSMLVPLRIMVPTGRGSVGFPYSVLSESVFSAIYSILAVLIVLGSYLAIKVHKSFAVMFALGVIALIGSFISYQSCG